MGLDMHLYRRHYVKQWTHIKPERQYAVQVSQGGTVRDDIRSDRVAYAVEEVAYWRKANQIHAWFVANCQDGTDDCGHHHVERSQLVDLLDLVKRVQANRGTAEEELPTQSSFFFGGTEYDEYYWQDLADTEAKLTAILAEPDPDHADFEYHSSW